MTESEKTAHNTNLQIRIPDDEGTAWDIFEREPLVHELVKKYAKHHDCTIEDVIYGKAGDAVSVGAPYLGYTTVGEVARAQELLNESPPAGATADVLRGEEE